MLHVTFDSLKKQTALFKQSLQYQDVQNTAISEGSVSWHIAHCLLVVCKLVSAMETSNPAEFKYTFSLLKFAMFTFKKIPRGKRKAPKIVIPPENKAPSYFQELFVEFNNKLDILRDLPQNSHVKHPALGIINKKELITFLFVHNKHHMAIMNDIVKSKG